MASTKQITIEDVVLYNLETVVEENGNLVAIESNIDLPFPIERIFYVFGVKDQDLRGRHAHFKTQQLLICINGQIEVTCKDGTLEKIFLLDSPQQGLFIPERIWDEQMYKSKHSTLLSICSTKYNPDDYIHEYKEFQILKDKEGRAQ